MAVPERELMTLGPWPQGTNNLALETGLPRGAFRKGVNVDVTDNGRVVRRDGRVKVLDGPATSLFGYGNRGFYLSGQSLMGFEIVDGALTEPVELATGLRPDARLAHALVEPDIYVSDGDRALRISPSNAVSPWGLPIPPAPAVSAGGTGGLSAGRYHVAYAYKAASGEESALSDSTVVDVEEGQAVTIGFTYQVSGLRTSVYMTKANGTELLHVATFPGQPPSMTVHKQNLGRPAPTENTDPLPAGQCAVLWNGRLLIGQDNMVLWSEPMQYSLYRAAYNYMVLAETVTALAATETSEGFFVGQQSRTYFSRGADPNDAALNEVYPAGIVAGTVAYVPGARLPLENPPSERVPMWLATNGVFCVGLPTGSVLPLTETRFAAMTAQYGAAMFDQRAGKSRYVATLQNPSENNFAMTDSISAEVVRNNLTT